ncbi:hypothetical protein EH220_03610 [bacterium]|nr:MAG: hypothetical protein EH220_03610 [bacterium]
MRIQSKQSLVLILLLLFAVTAAARKRDYPATEWGLRIAVGAIYNDNLLRFSDADLERFFEFDDRFATPIETVDDFETEYSIRPSFRWRAPLNLMVDGYYNLKAVLRSSNSFTDYQTHTLSASVRPRVRGYRWSFQYRAFRIPSYYLRVYRDRDYNEQHAARFMNWDHSAQFDYRVRSDAWLTFGVGYGTYYYNEKFTEYDSEYLEASVGARINLPADVSLSAGYTRRGSDNVGKDQGFTPQFSPESSPFEEDSEYGDADFNEDEFRLRARRRLDFVKLTDVDASLSYRLRRRVYTTDRSLLDDPFHRGRLDNRFEISPSIDIELSRRFDIGIYYLHEERDTESDSEAVIRAKNFVRREYGMTLSCTVR